MEVAILSSQSEKVDNYNLCIAKSIANILANEGYNLIFGGSSKSMMGICYNEFLKKGREIYAFGIPQYNEELIKLTEAKCFIRETTFDLKKSMYENSDLIVVLPGGIGVLSELFAYIEESRNRENPVPIEIYNENHYYDKFFTVLDEMINQGFVDEEIKNYYKVSHNKDEFLNDIYSSKMKGRK